MGRERKSRCNKTEEHWKEKKKKTQNKTKKVQADKKGEEVPSL